MAGINFDFTTGSLPGAITFTRASIGTYNNSSNILTTASANVARFNYVGGVANLLIEPAATNLLKQSNNFSAAAWSPTSTTVAAAQFISPDGTNDGWTLTNTASNGYVVQNITYSNIPYVMSVWVDRVTGIPNLQLLISWSIGSGVIPLTTTLTRLSFTTTPAAAIDGAVIQQLLGAGGVMGIYGAQVESGSVPTSYIPTTTAAVTRAADSAVFTIPAGIGHLTYTFDDNSTQLVTAAPGSYTIPTNLNRANIKSIVGIQTTPSTVQLGPFQSLALSAGTPVQLTAGGVYYLYILNTGPGNLYVSTGNMPGANAQSMLIPSLKAAPFTTSGAPIWLASDQDGGVSIAAMAR